MSHKYPVKSYYKYRPLYSSGEGNPRVVHPFTESIFTKGEIYYSAPSAFNDPFDCNLQMHLNDATEEDWINYYKRRIPTMKDGVHKQNTLKFLQDKGWQKIDPSRALVYYNGKIYKESSVFCLSKKYNSIPMFSYYADQHRGIAIEFTFTLRSIPCGLHCTQYLSKGNPYYTKIMSYEVDYSEEFPDLNYHRLTEDPLYMRKLIFIKAIEWKHEQEYRIFRSEIPAGTIKYDLRLLTRVVLGCKTGQAELDLVKGWLKDWPSSVIISKAVQAKDRFELNIEDIDSAGT
jgi:hypothetical protein